MADIFEQNGKPLCNEKRSIAKQKKGTNSANVKAVSSVFIRLSIGGPDEATADWMIQKLLPKNAGPNRPLPLKIQWVDPQIRKWNTPSLSTYFEKPLGTFLEVLGAPKTCPVSP